MQLSFGDCCPLVSVLYYLYSTLLRFATIWSACQFVFASLCQLFCASLLRVACPLICLSVHLCLSLLECDIFLPAILPFWTSHVCSVPSFHHSLSLSVNHSFIVYSFIQSVSSSVHLFPSLSSLCQCVISFTCLSFVVCCCFVSLSLSLFVSLCLSLS